MESAGSASPSPPGAFEAFSALASSNSSFLTSPTSGAYVRELEDKGLAFDTIRLRLFPIKATWKLVSENHPDLVRPLPRIKLAAPAPREIECLDSEEVDALLGWLRENARDVWPIATLQALSGLRKLEATALRIQDVDFDEETVNVTGTGHHKPKNNASWRTIPICGESVEALRVAATEQKLRPVTGELLVNRIGNLWTSDRITRRTTDVFRQAAEALGNPRIATIPSRKLRASFATTAGRMGVSSDVLRRYLGHTGGSVLNEHYRRIDLDELRLVSDAIERRKALAKKASGWKDPGNSAQREHASL